MSQLLNGRYILLAKLSDATGEAWISAFNEQAEQILGRSAEDLSLLRSQVWPSKIICFLGLQPSNSDCLVFQVGQVSTNKVVELRDRVNIIRVFPQFWCIVG